MSKLSKEIRKIGRIEPAPMGFAAVATREKPATLLCAVRLDDAGKAVDAASKGADIVIVDDAKAGGLDNVEGAVIGVTGDFDKAAMKELRKAGADFIVLSGYASPAEGLLEEKIGRVLTIDPGADDTTLRLIGDLGLDAVILQAPELPLTVERLLSVRRVHSLAHTALLVAVPADIDLASLHLLRDSGAAGVILDDAGKVKDIRERILELPPRGLGKDEKREPLLPVNAAMGGDDEEDDDWDD